jgi:microcystin degradation protein MlrC
MIASASGYTTQTKELKELMQKGFDYVKQGKIIDFSIFQVQPWLDVNEMASVVTVIGSDEKTAKEITKELAIGEFELRDKIQGESFYTIEEVIQKARENKSGKPIIICDSADSPNAGASGDSAFVVEKLLCVKDEFNIAVAVNDVKAVNKAFELGIGGVGDFTIGATICPKLSKPVTVHGATVEKLGDGNFVMFGPESKGERFSIGKCAVIKTGKMNILISYYGKCEGDRNFYNFMGINPELMDIVDVKACTSFRAGYKSICAGIYNVQTMGAANPVISLLPYEKRPKPLYPFEEITVDLVDEPKSYR